MPLSPFPAACFLCLLSTVGPYCGPFFVGTFPVACFTTAATLWSYFLRSPLPVNHLYGYSLLGASGWILSCRPFCLLATRQFPTGSFCRPLAVSCYRLAPSLRLAFCVFYLLLSLTADHFFVGAFPIACFSAGHFVVGCCHLVLRLRSVSCRPFFTNLSPTVCFQKVVLLLVVAG